MIVSYYYDTTNLINLIISKFFGRRNSQIIILALLVDGCCIIVKCNSCYITTEVSPNLLQVYAVCLDRWDHYKNPPSYHIHLLHFCQKIKSASTRIFFCFWPPAVRLYQSTLLSIIITAKQSNTSLLGSNLLIVEFNLLSPCHQIPKHMKTKS